MPTNIDYAALRELCDAATPGPWKWIWAGRIVEWVRSWFTKWPQLIRHESYGVAVQYGEGAAAGNPGLFTDNGLICLTHHWQKGYDNARFIAQARTHCPAMYAMMIEHADAAIAAEDAYPAECAAAVSTEGTPESRRIAGRKFDQAAGAIRATRATTAALLKVLQPQNTAEGGRDV